MVRLGCYRSQLQSASPRSWHPGALARGDRRNRVSGASRLERLKPMTPDSSSSRDDGNSSWKRKRSVDPGLATVVAAFILATGGVVGIVVGRATVSGARTPAAGPTVTRTVTASPGHSTAPSTGTSSPTPSGPEQGGTVHTMAAQLVKSSGAGLDLNKGQVNLNGAGGDLIYDSNDPPGVPELISDLAEAYSLDVTSQNASKQQCLTATSTHPDAHPITNFHKGLLFCVETQYGAGIALMEQTQPLGSSKTLQLREIYWLNSSN